MTDVVEDLVARRRQKPRCRRGGDRIIQIPLNGPVRYGSVLNAHAHNPSPASLTEWDNGVQEWIRDDDFVPLRVWFVGDEKKKPGPTLLQDLLENYLGRRSDEDLSIR